MLRRDRRSVRVPGYDYSQPGAYFVTVAAYKKEWLFGDVRNGLMTVNDLGAIVQEEWLRSAELRPEIELDQCVVMPNHFHGIVIIGESMHEVGASSNVGAHGCAPRRSADQAAVRQPRSSFATTLN